MLLGKDNERVRKFRHDQLSTYGIGAELDMHGWRSVIRQLLANGQLQPDPDGFGGLVVGAGAAAVLKGEAKVVLRVDERPRRPRAAKVRASDGAAEPFLAEDATPEQESLFQALRVLRTEIAREQGVPPYVVFHDRTLREMVARHPRTLDELAQVSGVGETKLERYGERFLAVLDGAP